MPSPSPTVELHLPPIMRQQEVEQRIGLHHIVPAPAQVVDTAHACLIGVVDAREGWVVRRGGVDQESDHLFIGSLAGDEEAVLKLMRLVPLVHTSHQHGLKDLKLLTHLWVVLFGAQLEAVDDLGSLRCATI